MKTEIFYLNYLYNIAHVYTFVFEAARLSSGYLGDLDAINEFVYPVACSSFFDFAIIYVNIQILQIFL